MLGPISGFLALLGTLVLQGSAKAFGSRSELRQALESWTFDAASRPQLKNAWGPIWDWDVSAVRDMRGLFQDLSSFDEEIQYWNTSQVTDMSRMFYGARAFNHPIEAWDTSAVLDMSHMFRGASSFDRPIGAWNTAAVKDMSHMFRGASQFNQPIGAWDTNSVTDMSYSPEEFASARSGRAVAAKVLQQCRIELQRCLEGHCAHGGDNTQILSWQLPWRKPDVESSGDREGIVRCPCFRGQSWSGQMAILLFGEAGSSCDVFVALLIRGICLMTMGMLTIDFWNGPLAVSCEGYQCAGLDACAGGHLSLECIGLYSWMMQYFFFASSVILGLPSASTIQVARFAAACVVSGLVLDGLWLIGWLLMFQQVTSVAVHGADKGKDGVALPAVISAESQGAGNRRSRPSLLARRHARRLFRGRKVTWSARLVGRMRLCSSRLRKWLLRNCFHHNAVWLMGCHNIIILGEAPGQHIANHTPLELLPLLRGGGGTKKDALLTGLKQLLDKVDKLDGDEQDEAEDPQVTALFDDLRKLLERRPRNALQELKSLVTRHTKAIAHPPPVLRRPTAGPDPPARTVTWKEAPVEEAPTWVSVVKRKKKKTAAQGSKSEQVPSAKGTWHFRQADWQPATGCPLAVARSLDELGRGIDESSGVSWIFQTDSAQEAGQAVSMVEGAIRDDDAQNLVVIFDGRAEELDDGMEKAALVSTPGIVDGRLTLKRVWHIPVGTRHAVLTSKAESPLVVSKPPPSFADQRAASFVLRISADYRYAETSWEALSKKPSVALRSWAASVGISPHAVIDCWNFAKEDKWVISGFLRVRDSSSAQQLFHASGKQFGTHRFFCDVLGDKSRITEATKVLWMAWSPDESYAAYLDRLLQASPHGLALGRSQLGLKISPTDSRWQHPRCTWRLKGIPAHWAGPDVEHLLVQTGFAETELTAKIRRRGGCEWLVKASRTDERVILQQPVDWDADGSNVSDFVAMKEANRRPKGDKVEPIKDVGAAFLSFGDCAKISRKVTDVSAQKPSDTERDAGGTGSRKRPAVEEDKSMEVEHPWFPACGVVVTNPGEGNCLWHSFAELVSTSSSQRSHRQLRAYTCAVLKKDPYFSEVWELQGRPNAHGKPGTQSWDQYVEEQGTNGVWSGALEAGAFAKAQDLRVWVISTENELHLINPDGGKGYVVLKFDHLKEHYEAVVDVGEEVVKQRYLELNLTGSKASSKLLRGGVKLDGSCSSVRLSDFASEHSGKGGNERFATTGLHREAGRPSSLPCLSDFASVDGSDAGKLSRRDARSVRVSEFASRNGASSKRMKRPASTFSNMNLGPAAEGHDRTSEVAHHSASSSPSSSSRLGLATSNTCFCGWVVPDDRYFADKMPNRARKRHWRDCTQCTGSCPKRPLLRDQRPERNQIATAILQTKLSLARKRAAPWQHDLVLDAVLPSTFPGRRAIREASESNSQDIQRGTPSICRLCRCVRCDAIGTPSRMLSNLCSKAKQGCKTPKAAERNKYASKLHKLACEVQRKCGKAARKARIIAKDEVAVRVSTAKPQHLSKLIKRRKGAGRRRQL